MTAYYDPRADWSRDDVEAARPALETLPVIWHGDHEHYSVTELEVCEDDRAYLRSYAETIDWRAACNLLGLDADWSMS